MTKRYLNNAQALTSADTTKQLYADWAASYDAEITENGYASPERTAQALAECGAALDRPLLDIGCGSGISGLFLKQAGFTTLDGSDFSEEMLAFAREKGIYRNLHSADLAEPFAKLESVYPTIAAIGVFAPGHAEPQVIEAVMDLLHPGGLFGFSLNDHTLENPGYLSEIARLVTEKKVRVRWQEYGDHLPGIELNSLIMVLERI